MELKYGFRFCPNDEELLRFLRNFIVGRYHGIIQQKNMYGDEEPWEMFLGDGNICYFFTPLQRKSEKGARFVRTVGKAQADGKRPGTWKGQNKGQPVYNEYHRLLGYIRNFVYKNRNEADEDGQWLVKEYYLSDHAIRTLELEGMLIPERKDFVLCRLKKKKRRDVIDKTENAEEALEGFIDRALGLSTEMFDNSTIPSPPAGVGEEEDNLLMEEYFQGVEIEEPLLLESQPVTAGQDYNIPFFIDAETQGYRMEEPPPLLLTVHQDNVEEDTNHTILQPVPIGSVYQGDDQALVISGVQADERLALQPDPQGCDFTSSSNKQSYMDEPILFHDCSLDDHSDTANAMTLKDLDDLLSIIGFDN